MNKFPELPNKMSELIRVAVADLKAAEQSDDLKVDMSLWFQPGYGGGACAVCLAGAVMAGTLQIPVKEHETLKFFGRSHGGRVSIYPYDLENEENPFWLTNNWRTPQKLSDLNSIRAMGHIAFTHYIDMVPDGEKLRDIQVDMPTYISHPDEFKANLLELADKLEAVGH